MCDIELYTEITGDRNYDQQAAREGGVTSGLLNALVAEDLPGPGSVFLDMQPIFHLTSIPGVTLRRRHAPTEQIRRIYTFGLTVVEQGSKKVLIGQQICDYHPGQCTLTTIDQPLVSHVKGRERSPVAARIALSTERLQRCQRDQAEPRLTQCIVSAIARGAATTSPVSRAFKAKDGISPREHCRKGTVNSAAALCA